MASEYLVKISDPILSLKDREIPGLSGPMCRKLANAIASYVDKNDAADATVEDLLSYFPMRYEDRSNLIGIDHLGSGDEAAVDLYVRVSGAFRVGKNRGAKAPPLYIFEITAGDINRIAKPVVVWWFVSGKQAFHAINFYKEKFSRGTRFIAHGKWEWDSRRATFALRLGKPDELELLPASEGYENFGLFGADGGEQESAADQATDAESTSLDDSNFYPTIHTARRVPVYRKLGQFQTKKLREIIFGVLERLDDDSVVETLPDQMRSANDLIALSEAVRQIHFPPDSADINQYHSFRSPAQRRIIFEEFFWLTFALSYVRKERLKEPKGTKITLDDTVRHRIESILPFELTGAQRRVTEKIFEDMLSDSPMNRLVQGDVGSGKTIVAIIAMMVAMEAGYQTVLMAPTEILAEQHYRNVSSLLGETGHPVGLLKGSMKAAEKRAVQQKVAAGEIRALIGTHAVIQDAVIFENLGLAVVDEQHRFGVLQRAELKARGFNPDILVMTATPIPRSLAMTVYGDLDVSVIDELPPGRTPVQTVVVGDDKRAGVYKGIEREVSLGRQAYVVYPLVDESEKLDLKAATKMYEELRDKIFPHLEVGLVHGKMKAAEKEEVMAGFVSGKIQILVSTTVIEVGVDVPNASLMIIEHAERFGLSQLHQLRGRVGRGAEKSYCVLLTDDKQTAVAKERLGIMEETSDGFRIAEKDLEIRGQGEILGTRQSGVQSFKLANLVRDLEILEKARSEAGKQLQRWKDGVADSKLVEIALRKMPVELAGVG